MEHLSPLVAQLVTYFLPFDDISIKMACGFAISGLIFSLLSAFKNKFTKFNIFNRKNRVVVSDENRLFSHITYYFYKKNSKNIKECVYNDLVKNDILINELKGICITDVYENHKIEILFSKDETDKLNYQHRIVFQSCAEIRIIEKYIEDLMKQVNSSSGADLYIYTISRQDKKKNREKNGTVSYFWEKSKLITNKSLVNTIVSDDVKKLFFDDLQVFLNSRDAYDAKGISYKRGYLLYGEPGCGKTSIIRAIAKTYNLPVFIADLTILKDNETVITVLKDIKNYVSDHQMYLLIFEDFDRSDFFRGWRSSVTQDCFLNALDGVDENYGRITIFTTNDIDVLKKVKGLTRPGRIDVHIPVTICTREQMTKIIKFYMEIPDDVNIDLHEDIIITPAQLMKLIFTLKDVNILVRTLNEVCNFSKLDNDKLSLLVTNAMVKEPEILTDKPTSNVEGQTETKEKKKRKPPTRPEDWFIRDRLYRNFKSKYNILNKKLLEKEKSCVVASTIRTEQEKCKEDVEKLILEELQIKAKIAQRKMLARRNIYLSTHNKTITGTPPIVNVNNLVFTEQSNAPIFNVNDQVVSVEQPNTSIIDVNDQVVLTEIHEVPRFISGTPTNINDDVNITDPKQAQLDRIKNTIMTLKKSRSLNQISKRDTYSISD